jgi:uncharacterized protein YbjQ (UPF0145 family)
MTQIRPSAGVLPARITEKKTAMTTLNGASEMQLLNEALSRARMRRPQAGRTTTSSEATRSARTIAMEARRRTAREMGAL